MSRKHIFKLFLAFFSLVPMTFYSQEAEENSKLLDHYVGIQINELVKQILNISSSESPEHPYFINYALNHSKSGWGLNTGIGYVLSTSNEGDAINRIENEITQLSFRIGPEKKFYLGKKMILALGVDYTVFQNNNKSVTRIDQGQDQFFETTVEEIIKSSGFGPRLAFSYRLSKWILVGTELSYYHSTEKISQKVEILNSFNNSETKQETTDEFTNKSLSFSTPSVLFVVIQF